MQRLAPARFPLNPSRTCARVRKSCSTVDEVASRGDRSRPGADMIVFDEEFNQIKQIISRLRLDANAKMVFLVDRNGQQIAAQGDIEAVDGTAVASLAAGNVAATDGLARLLGEKEFSGIFHE